MTTHCVSGIDWKHYKHPLPENVFDVYVQYWKDVEFKPWNGHQPDAYQYLDELQAEVLIRQGHSGTSS
jgi:hypothetical protein